MQPNGNQQSDPTFKSIIQNIMILGRMSLSRMTVHNSIQENVDNQNGVQQNYNLKMILSRITPSSTVLNRVTFTDYLSELHSVEWQSIEWHSIE
jgi:hypothetical protein